MTRKTGTKFHSGIAEAVHEMASGLHRIELIDQETMREFDASCLTAVEPLTPEEILELRDRAGVTQGVFARYLNVQPKLVSEWERGQRSTAARPSNFSRS